MQKLCIEQEYGGFVLAFSQTYARIGGHIVYRGVRVGELTTDDDSNSTSDARPAF